MHLRLESEFRQVWESSLKLHSVKMNISAMWTEQIPEEPYQVKLFTLDGDLEIEKSFIYEIDENVVS